MAFPINLTGLTTREAITDAVYRCTLAFDTGDAKLLESASTEDAIIDLDGMVISGLDDIRTKVLGSVGKLDTTHLATNLRIDIKSERRNPAATRFLVGGMYFIDMIKDEKDGLWKSKHWKVQITWNEGDGSVMPGR
ncbi:hypothetical protein LTR56_022357 [Elasticomyces elasticus]|nr:hypothetical protein LTR56_022357 [Elasticomyces elasticus]KAK3627601.1 hypothetical protein LTR22_022697 [Elasticomyces elasticus]KAK4907732.1 hypothetical protein LTR49_023263 [Elasticomyces elasticus]KAK5737420.1 hypothetical protein LTS12_025891 [Elasticomyces elasticus]